MNDAAERFVAVLDANVLYPFGVRDALLRFAEAGLYRAHWSAEILNEWTQNLLLGGVEGRGALVAGAADSPSFVMGNYVLVAFTHHCLSISKGLHHGAASAVLP